MVALVPTNHYATIVHLGRVPHRDRREIDGESVQEMPLTWEGMAGEIHAGLTRPSCGRVTSQHPRDTEIRNVRQLSILSQEELDEVAATLELDKIDPDWLGASVVLSGIPDFSHIPPSSRLQSESGVTLTVDMLNEPCNLVSMTIEEARPGQGKGFKAAAEGKRGVTAWVERPGSLFLGDKLRLHVPRQRAWQG